MRTERVIAKRVSTVVAFRSTKDTETLVAEIVANCDGKTASWVRNHIGAGKRNLRHRMMKRRLNRAIRHDGKAECRAA